MADFIESGEFKMDGDVIPTPFEPTGGVTDHWPEFGDNRPSVEDEFREMEADGVDPDDMVRTGERALGFPVSVSMSGLPVPGHKKKRKQRPGHWRWRNGKWLPVDVAARECVKDMVKGERR